MNTGLKGDRSSVPSIPGGDYEHYDYPNDCVVIDNPPFSILSQIIDFYRAHNIDFFMFCPALVSAQLNVKRPVNLIITNTTITYENGAQVATGFVTNLGEYRIHVSSELHDIIMEAQADRTSPKPKYEYPDNVLTTGGIQKIARCGVTLKIRAADCHCIRYLDSQKAKRKGLYGGGFLLSDEATAAKLNAERMAAENLQKMERTYIWTLSEREKEIIENLSKNKEEI